MVFIPGNQTTRMYSLPPCILVKTFVDVSDQVTRRKIAMVLSTFVGHAFVYVDHKAILRKLANSAPGRPVHYSASGPLGTRGAQNHEDEWLSIVCRAATYSESDQGRRDDTWLVVLTENKQQTAKWSTATYSRNTPTRSGVSRNCTKKNVLQPT